MAVILRESWRWSDVEEYDHEDVKHEEEYMK
jgi:hypothetical protein